ncbi:MAG: riboflavin biosynthesis protein RibF [Bdellovibrionaceae bacterium]|nr:riboflavin biosynthesis protein RibF [Pseudobdellovibrionaceae bacterium]
MHVLRSLEEVKLLGYQESHLTMGRFQGLHRGHRALIQALDSGDKKVPKVVISFDPTPEDVLSETQHKKLFSVEDKITCLRELGVDCVFLIPFSKTLASLDPESFAKQYIFAAFNPSLIVVGYDFAFGRSRLGTIETLKKVGGAHVHYVQLESIKSGKDVISTSLIRSEIQVGNVERAGELLLRPYYVDGMVVHGEKRGRKLGFPTINLLYSRDVILPASGVYVADVVIAGEHYKSVCNIGTNPTFSQGQEVKWECHLLDFDRDIYNASVRVHFYKKLRSERKFSSQEELIEQIQKDVTSARETSLTLPNG